MSDLRNEFALSIGNHVLDSIQKMQEDKKDFGRSVIVPFNVLPQMSDAPPWMSSIEIAMPRFIRRYYDKNGNPKFEHITMAKYYGWK